MFIFFKWKKPTTSVKHYKAKCNKIRCACTTLDRDNCHVTLYGFTEKKKAVKHKKIRQIQLEPEKDSSSIFFSIHGQNAAIKRLLTTKQLQNHFSISSGRHGLSYLNFFTVSELFSTEISALVARKPGLSPDLG